MKCCFFFDDLESEGNFDLGFILGRKSFMNFFLLKERNYELVFSVFIKVSELKGCLGEFWRMFFKLFYGR